MQQVSPTPLGHVEALIVVDPPGQHWRDPHSETGLYGHRYLARLALAITAARSTRVSSNTLRAL
jgi:hypothetical protein